MVGYHTPIQVEIQWNDEPLSQSVNDLSGVELRHVLAAVPPPCPHSVTNVRIHVSTLPNSTSSATIQSSAKLKTKNIHSTTSQINIDPQTNDTILTIRNDSDKVITLNKNMKIITVNNYEDFYSDFPVSQDILPPLTEKDFNLSETLTVWCALWAGGIIGPYFFKNDEFHNVTVNGDRYRAMITNFFIPELNNHDVQELWFQQDGVTCHTARATIDLLKDTFGDRLISRFGPVNWPPRSWDLTPLDYFLWGYVKLLVYADKPQTLDHLEDNIRRVIADIRPQMLEKVIENWTSRLDYLRASRGSPMPEIIFKM
ncbi:uncharacterized protein TNCV_3065741 [Trichonephila clavipes]|uniref:Transposase n=2 Tax=Trichonephila clavipes TaxID=2585209 RepID=A0A8X6RRG1_TRICX|nr:uncharacterized protein TNCV_3065741 [Trichonephila clavipes]